MQQKAPLGIGVVVNWPAMGTLQCSSLETNIHTHPLTCLEVIVAIMWPRVITSDSLFDNFSKMCFQILSIVSSVQEIYTLSHILKTHNPHCNLQMWRNFKILPILMPPYSKYFETIVWSYTDVTQFFLKVLSSNWIFLLQHSFQIHNGIKSSTLCKFVQFHSCTWMLGKQHCQASSHDKQQFFLHHKRAT